MRRAACRVAIAGAFAAVVLSAATPRMAAAEVRGNCQATIAGQDIAPLSSSDPSQAIHVHYHDTITVQATTNRPVGSYTIALEIFGVRRTVADGTSGSTSWTRNVNVS